MKILLMGPQGCGKGTQGELLSNHLDLPLIGIGAILRNIEKSSPHHHEANEYMNAGRLVPPQLVANLLQERLSKQDCDKGYILDGWMRNLEQMKYFDPQPDIVIEIKISREESLIRITGRRICEPTGEIFNIYTLPKSELEKCEGKLVQRDDDTEDAVTKRLQIYYTETIQVIDKYKKESKLISVDGNKLPEEVFQDILKALEIKPNLPI